MYCLDSDGIFQWLTDLSDWMEDWLPQARRHNHWANVVRTNIDFFMNLASGFTKLLNRK